MIRLVLVLVLASAGCYEPSYSECAVRCNAATDCAPSQVCDGDGWCVGPERATACITPIADDSIIDAAPDSPPDDATLPDGPPSTGGDAAPMPDAPPDAPPPPSCSPSCVGDCVAGVCVIRCMGNKSCSSVSCPATGACRIECVGKESCKNVACGTGPCTVICSGNESCEDGVWCAAACACDVACTGNESCDDEATCPSSACELGDGCTSQGPTCNEC